MAFFNPHMYTHVLTSTPSFLSALTPFSLPTLTSDKREPLGLTGLDRGSIKPSRKTLKFHKPTWISCNDHCKISNAKEEHDEKRIESCAKQGFIHYLILLPQLQTPIAKFLSTRTKQPQKLPSHVSVSYPFDIVQSAHRMSCTA